jgi:Putative Ig domain
VQVGLALGLWHVDVQRQHLHHRRRDQHRGRNVPARRHRRRADPVTGAAFIAGWHPDNNIWVAKPSAADELSPMDYGFPVERPSATFAVGVPSSFALMLSALPAATITETEALPPGVTMSSSGVFSGTPAAGTVGTYPITVSASNGVGPDSDVSLEIVVDIAPRITSLEATAP